jgi:hypothetical protein
MTRWLLIAIGVDVAVLILGLLLQKSYLRHMRHKQRPFWEEMNQRAPNSWGMFRGMPTTGLLISTYISDREFKAGETARWLNLGRFIVLLNLIHAALLVAIVLMSGAMFLQGS